MIFTGLLMGALILYGVWEFARHQRNIQRVRIRVLVNGTRGKSSVTRLIAGGMRQGGIRTLGKTTGTSPRLIAPDGTESPIIRAGKANIIEQVMVFRRAADMGVEALVTECMAVLPPNQTIMQNQLVRSTIGVITNARADHLDDMGPTVEDVALCLCRTIPRGGVVFTAERDHLGLISGEAERAGAGVVSVTGAEVDDEVLRRFTYLEHRENVALALAVCTHLGVERETALAGMIAAQPDPGVLRIFSVRYHEKELSFVNAFAANDPDSYARIWTLLPRYADSGDPLIVVVNCRQDRIQRTESMAELIARRIRADHFLLTGEFTQPLYNRALALGLGRDRLRDLGGVPSEAVFQEVLSLAPRRAMVVGIGNIVGLGEEIVRSFTNRGREIVY